MELGLKINKIPLELGQELPQETLDAGEIRRSGLLRRLIAQQPVDQTVYAIDDCELEGLNDELHIYPCTHSYLNHDRQWRTRVTLFLKKDRLHRILFQVMEGQTAALNFFERFEAAAAKLIGDPERLDHRTVCWQCQCARVESRLHPDQVNADFIIELKD
jgi:hypothetical protein